ncbi:MAG TPA: O-antigen ligase family protein [Allosphingosinicella sp.]|nr:O-antigen ligase family protein [Allosphingosinicella sp.]
MPRSAFSPYAGRPVSDGPARAAGAPGRPLHWAEQLAFPVLLLLLGLCLLGGGASRADVTSLIYLRPAAILCVAALLLLPGRRDYAPVRVPLILLGALAALMVIQLIPLPPEIWTALPGRERYLEAYAAIGIPQPWRPISLTPDLTLNSLATLIFAAAGLIGFASISSEQRVLLLPVLIGVAFVSAMIGVAQVSSDAGSALFLYNVTHEGSSVGFFSNRNHQAALLAMSFPMLQVWTLLPHPDKAYRRTRRWIAIGVGLLLIPLLLITGSRAGVGLGVVGLLAMFFLAPRQGRGVPHGKWRVGRTLLFVLGPIAAAGVVVLLGRAVAFERLASREYLAQEARFEAAPQVWQMVTDFFPVGTGFGAFDRVYRGYEADKALDFSYLNHAHNDLAELVIDGGLAALLLFVLFLLWWGRQALRAVRTRRLDPRVIYARLAVVLTLILFLASLVDYPLRTPLMGLIFAIVCGWLGQLSSESSALAVEPGANGEKAAVDQEVALVHGRS